MRGAAGWRSIALSNNCLQLRAVLLYDMDFQIDVSQNLVSGPVHWSSADEEPTFRGQMFKEGVRIWHVVGWTRPKNKHPQVIQEIEAIVNIVLTRRIFENSPMRRYGILALHVVSLDIMH